MWLNVAAGRVQDLAVGHVETVGRRYPGFQIDWLSIAGQPTG
jgi:hypothetical protein